MSFLPLVRLWLWVSALASVSGWLLSGLGQLNREGYAACLPLGLILLGVGRRSLAAEWVGREFPWRTIAKRFRRPLPLAFVALSLLVLAGGILYPPTNHTALTYRLPRVLQWLAHGHWFWVHTQNYRMNDRACGIEWLSAPFILFTKSDRGLFLLNFIPFLLLPGLLFSLFTRAGVAPRVAWQWMWLLPTGYTFLVQAGSAANDTFPTVYALAAVDFAARAWNSRRQANLAYSLLAAALLTGAKASNLPLLLPWAFLFAPVFWREVRSLSLTSFWIWLWIAPLAALVSFLPTAVLNLHYCGDWSGLAMERTGMDMKNPLVGIWGNGFLFLLDNLVPPFFPMASWWNQNGLSVLPHVIAGPLVANFEASFHWLGELPTEDWAGLGFGITWLAIISWIAARRRTAPVTFKQSLPPKMSLGVRLLPWVSLLAYCVKSGMATGARLISPYYPFLLPLILAGPGQSRVVRQRWWRTLMWVSLGLATLVLVLTPGRPLWPAQTLLGHIHATHPESRLVGRALAVYSVYSTRADPLAKVREALPPGLKVIGFMGRGDDPDISFWRPFGEKRVEHILPSDSAAEIRARGIDYAVAGDINFGLSGTTFEAWQKQTGAELVAVVKASVRVSEPPQSWFIVRFPRD